MIPISPRLQPVNLLLSYSSFFAVAFLRVALATGSFFAATFLGAFTAPFQLLPAIWLLPFAVRLSPHPDS